MFFVREVWCIAVLIYDVPALVPGLPEDPSRCVASP